MFRIRYLVLSITLVCFIASANAQVLGLRSSRVKWRQIDSDTVRVIFPEGNYLKANRISNIIHALAKKYPTSERKLRKVKILLQEESTISNGYVGFAPYRSEFYLQPAENAFELGSLEFSDLLAIHEFRHVQQLSATNTGISGLVGILFGQDAYSASVHLAVPDWFLEGDAVIAETALTNQGRGRLSAFMKGFREKMNAGEVWNYEQLRNGSFKKWLPNQYPLGFLLCNYGREQYGQTFWNDVVQDGAAYKGLFYSFSNAVKKRTDLNTTEFYKKALEQKSDEWKIGEQIDVQYEKVPILNTSWANEKKYRNYLVPSVDGNGNVYTIIDRFDKINAIHRITPDGKMEKVVTLGSQNAPFFSLGQNKLAWAEFRAHPRWERQDHTVIMIYDLETKTKKQLAPKGKYFTPGIDHSGRRVAALHTDAQGQHSVHIIDISTGSIIKELPNLSNYYLGYPNFNPDGTKIIASARDANGKMSIVYQDIASGLITPLTHWSMNIYGRAIQYDNWIFATSTLEKIDQVFAFNPTDGIPYRVTSGNKFHYSPAYDPVNDQIISSEFSLMGHRLIRTSGKPNDWVLRNMDSGKKPFFRIDDEKEVLENIANIQYADRKYSSLAHPINVHSWDVSADDPLYSVELTSENVLGSIGLVGGYRYNRNNKSYGPFLDATIGHWFPEITVGYRGTFSNVRDQNNNRFTIKQNTMSAGYRIPLRFTSGVFNQFFSIGSNINTGSIKLKPALDSFNPSRLSYLSHSIRFVNSLKTAEQHEVPQFAQSILATYAHDIDSLRINQFSLISDFSFPGFSPNHTFIFQVDYVKELISNGVNLGENFAFSRGYSPVENDEAIRFGVNYHMPVLYPDFGFGGILFVKRLRMKPFFDLTRYSFEGVNQNLKSVGTEVLFDINIFNVQPVTFGVRWSHLLDLDLQPSLSQNVFEFFIPIIRL